MKSAKKVVFQFADIDCRVYTEGNLGFYYSIKQKRNSKQLEKKIDFHHLFWNKMFYKSGYE